MNINTLTFSDNSKFKPGGIWSNAAQDIAKNYPACAVLFHQDDIKNGDKTWTDRVSGLTMTDSIGFIKDDLGVRRKGSLIITSGSMPTPGDQNMMMIFQGVMSGNNIKLAFGDINQVGTTFGLGLGVATYQVRNASNYLKDVVVAPAPSLPFVGAITTRLDRSISPAGTIKDTAIFDGTEIGNINVTTVNSSDPLGDIGGTWPQLFNDIDLSDSALSGVKTFSLFLTQDAIPNNEVVTQNLWMAANPGKFYPGMAGKLYAS